MAEFSAFSCADWKINKKTYKGYGGNEQPEGFFAKGPEIPFSRIHYRPKGHQYKRNANQNQRTGSL